MQLENEKKSSKAKARSRRAKSLAVIAAGAVLIFAAVRGSIAQDNKDTAAAPAPTATSSATDLISGGLTKGHWPVAVNRSAVVTTKSQCKQVSVSAPDIADVNLINGQTILVTAKKAGTTQLIVWDMDNHSQMVEVNVSFDTQGLEGELHQMFPNSNIRVAQLNGAIALSGNVPSLEVAEEASALASPYSAKVVNLMRVSGVKQVMLQVRFAEVSRSASTQLGINGNYISGAFIGGSNIGQVNPSSRMPDSGLVGQAPPFNGVNLNGATAVNPSVTVFGAGQIGNFYFEYFIQALRQNNLLRMLAEPNLIAASGEQAKFLAGGEFPVPVTQGGGGSGGTAVTVEYRQFGVQLNMTPVVLGNGKIRLNVAPEVSDLDFTTAVRFNGFVIPGLTSRKVATTVELGDGQTFAIAGLLNQNVTAEKDVTPLLGDIPVIGALFRSVRYQRKETELVVLVTPHLVDGMNPEQVPTLPGEHWRDPNELELYFNRDLGSEVPAKKKHTGASTQPVSTSADITASTDNALTTPDNAKASSADEQADRFRGDFGFVGSNSETNSNQGSTPTDQSNTSQDQATANQAGNQAGNQPEGTDSSGKSENGSGSSQSTNNSGTSGNSGTGTTDTGSGSSGSADAGTDGK